MSEALERLMGRMPALPESRKHLLEQWDAELRKLKGEISGLPSYAPLGGQFLAKLYGRKQELEILLTVCRVWEQEN